jgi:hypothetical protein
VRAATPWRSFFDCRNGLAERCLRQIGCQRGNAGDIENLRRVAERLVVLLQLLKLVGELRNLLHLVVHHVNVLGDVLGLVENLLHVADGS